MKKYNVKVNGFQYEVEIEEVNDALAGSMTTAPRATQSYVAPQPVAATTAAIQPVASSDSENISAPMQGKIIDVKVKVGEVIVPGQVVAILEAMKMENEIVASSEGTVTSVGVTAGQSVEAGDMLVAFS